MYRPIHPSLGTIRHLPGRLLSPIFVRNGIKCPHDLVGFGIIKLETMEDWRGTFLGQASANNDVRGEVE